MCPDYVTEKMFEALQHDIVPVVLGGADYAATFPAHSFINMRDFRNMADLAQYLGKYFSTTFLLVHQRFLIFSSSEVGRE